MKKILAIVLSVCLICACFSGCDSAPSDPVTPSVQGVGSTESKPTDATGPIQTEPEVTEVQSTEFVPSVQPASFVAFEPWQDEWIARGLPDDDTNVVISPLSLKMACLLAAAGADGETQAQLLNMFGYTTLDEFLDWGERIMGIQEELVAVDEETEDEADSMWYIGSMGTRGVFKIANSIWHNSNEPGEFKDEYKARVERLQAAIEVLPGSELKDAINNWANDATNGLIPKVVGDEVEQQNNILANALYLKASWLNEFDDQFLENEDFTTKSGEIVKKTMMTQEEKFRYYADDDSSLVILPMSSGFNMVIVKGNAENVLKKINEAKYELINLKMPKFDVTYRATNISNVMRQLGVVDAFDPAMADFSQLMDVDTFISSITQDSKIVVDENGVEAAAVTVIHMATSGIITEPPKPIDFFVDEAFTFYIYYEVEMPDGQYVPELLFYGEYNQ